MTEVNVPLLRKAVEWAESEAGKPLGESEWYQGAWQISPFMTSMLRATLELPEAGYDERLERSEQLRHSCGTAYCIAGYIGQALDARYASSDTVNGVHIADFAGEALGLTTDHKNDDGTPDHGSQRLFNGTNSIEDVRRIAEELAGERL